MTNYLLNTYNPLPVQFDRGKGVWLYDTHDNKYLDALCGIAVTGLGHQHPAVTKAIVAQAKKIIHTSNLVEIPQQQALAEALVTAVDMPAHVFFSNSGAEAIETAIKLTRLYGHSKNIDSPKVIVMQGAFHGRTMAALSACSSPGIQQGFEPLLPGFIRVPYNNMLALDHFSKDKEIAAVLLEPIQGEGGVLLPDTNYLKEVRALCTKNKWLMITDEIQTGMGRTGALFAFQHSGITPDAFTLAKGLANGVPIGACVIHEQFSGLFHPGSHGSTFGGNPLSCAAGLATLDEIMEKKLWENAAKQGKYLLNTLKRRLKKHPNVVDVRGMGCMIGIELDKPCRGVLSLALEAGIVFNVAAQKTLRLLPPLILKTTEAKKIADTLPELIDQFYADT